MGNLCGGPGGGGGGDNKQGLTKGKNDLRMIETGREAYAQCSDLIKGMTKSISQQNSNDTLVDEAYKIEKVLALGEVRNPESLLQEWIKIFTSNNFQMNQLCTMITDPMLRTGVMAMFQSFITYLVVYMAEIKDRQLTEIPRQVQTDFGKLKDIINRELTKGAKDDKYILYRDLTLLQWRAIDKLFAYGAQYTKFSKAQVSSWGNIAKFTMATVGIIDPTAAISPLAHKLQDMLEDYNQAYANDEISEIIAAFNRRELILEQYADVYTPTGVSSNADSGNLHKDLLDLLAFAGDKSRSILARYTILDTLQVASCIYHKKFTDDQAEKIGEMMVMAFKSLKDNAKMDQLDREIMMRKIVECHCAMKYYRRDQRSTENPLTSVKSTYKYIVEDEDFQNFVEMFTKIEDGFLKMLPFRQRCEEYSTTKFPRLTNLKKYTPQEKVDPFEKIQRAEFDEMVRKLGDLTQLKTLYERIQPAVEKGFGGLNAVLIVGGTGAGKSTMINSILYGPGILEKKGKKIAFKEEFSKKQENRIKIGMDDSKSMTTFPEKADDFLKIEGGFVFIDLAGILDSRGLRFDLVHAMMLGQLIKGLRQARFVHVLSKAEMEAARGSCFKGGLFMINGMCQDNLVNKTESVQLILSKWQKTDPTKEEARKTLIRHMEEFLAENINSGNQMLQNPLEPIVSNAVIYDPIEQLIRSTIDMPNGQQIARDDLLKKIVDLKPLQPKELQETRAPLTSEALKQLLELYSATRDKLTKEVQNAVTMIQEKKYTKEYDLKTEIPMIKEILECVQFFEDMKIFNLGENGLTVKQLNQIIQFENNMIKEHQQRFKLEEEQKALQNQMESMRRQAVVLEANQRELYNNLLKQKGESATIQRDIMQTKGQVQSLASGDLDKVRGMIEALIKLWELVDQQKSLEEQMNNNMDAAKKEKLDFPFDTTRPMHESTVGYNAKQRATHELINVSFQNILDSQHIMKVIFNLENMILQFEGQGAKEQHLIGIKQVYHDLLEEHFPSFFEIAKHVEFNDAGFLHTKNKAWQLQLFSSAMQESILLDNSTYIVKRANKITGKLPQFYMLIDSEGRLFLRNKKNPQYQLIWGDPNGVFNFYADGMALALKQVQGKKIQLLFILKNEEMDRGRLGIQTYQQQPDPYKDPITDFNYAIGAKKFEWTLNDDFSWNATMMNDP